MLNAAPTARRSGVSFTIIDTGAPDPLTEMAPRRLDNRSPNGSNSMNKILLLAAACLASQTAFAHAFLDRAPSAVGSEVTGSSPTLALTYTEPAEPLLCTVHVTGEGRSTLRRYKCCDTSAINRVTAIFARTALRSTLMPPRIARLPQTVKLPAR
jgi:methionine-rich copper-binding protein CopC